MEKTLLLKVVTPHGVKNEIPAHSVTLPGKDGSFGVLYGHAPMIAALGNGRIVCRTDTGETEIEIRGGIAKVKDNAVTVLTD